MFLEICANSYLSAMNAQLAGAHRIELCQELAVGGITPSFGMLKKVNEDLSIPVFVLIRPRASNFCYSEDEFEIMKQDIQICKELGCEGIVSGVLNEDKTIDLVRTGELVQLSKPMSFTFHRAFDEVKDPIQGLEQLIGLGVDRVLTSGQQPNIEEGLDALKELHKFANDRIIILPGGGVNSENVILLKNIGFNEVHASASSQIKDDTSLFSVPLSYSDATKIKAILHAI